MIEPLAAILGVVLSVLALIAATWKWVVLPNLREQLLDPVRENHRQLTENRHRNHQPTILDKLDDLENHVELLALNQLAAMRQMGAHIGESEADRKRLWLMVDSLIHEHHERGSNDKRSDPRGA